MRKFFLFLILSAAAWPAYSASPTDEELEKLIKSPDAYQHSNQILAYTAEGAQAAPEDSKKWRLHLAAGLLTQDDDVIRLSSAKLIELSPHDFIGYYYTGLLAVQDKKWEEAEWNLLKAKELGADTGKVDGHMKDFKISYRATFTRWTRWIGMAYAGWLAGFAVLTLFSFGFRIWTMRSVRLIAEGTAPEETSVVLGLRRFYRMIIILASAYFYFSIPFVLSLAVLLPIALFYEFLQLGRISGLVIAIGGISLFSIPIVVRSLFGRRPDTPLGRELSKEEAPALWSLAEEVARTVGTRSIEKMFVTPQTEIAVLERGGMMRKLRGGGERCLMLGLGALPGMSVAQFKAIVAHEYGHFSNRDTAGGDIAHRVNRVIFEILDGFQKKKAVSWMNLAWIFLSFYQRFFVQLTLGSSRLQEILADRCAVLTYGAENFIGGLTHVLRQDLVFWEELQQEVKTARAKNHPLKNFYQDLPAFLDHSAEIKGRVEEELEKIINRPTSSWDSHPSPSDRFVMARRLGRPTSLSDNRPCVSLLPFFDRLATEMTAVLQPLADS